MAAIEALELFGYAFWSMLKALFSLIPVLSRLSSLDDQIIASIFGVSVGLVSIVTTTIMVTKVVLKISKNGK